jgi:hypothetical protein
MSAVSIPGRRILVRVARVFAISVTFVCAGPLILMALYFGIGAILHLCYDVAILRNGSKFADWLATVSSAITWQLVTMFMAWAGPTGLIAGICEMLFGRINGRAMAAISLLSPSSLFVWYLFLPPLQNFISTGRTEALLTFAPSLAFLLFCVVCGISCWKITEAVWARTPAAGSLAPI